MNNENLWYETWVELIDGGEVRCSLNAVVNPDDNKVIYIVEDDGELEDFYNYKDAIEDYVIKAHSNLMKSQSE